MIDSKTQHYTLFRSHHHNITIINYSIDIMLILPTVDRIVQRIPLHYIEQNRFQTNNSKRNNQTDDEIIPFLPVLLQQLGLTLKKDLEIFSSNNDDLSFEQRTFQNLNLYSHVPNSYLGNDVKQTNDKYLLMDEIALAQYRSKMDQENKVKPIDYDSDDVSIPQVTGRQYFFAVPDEFKPKKFGQVCDDTLKFWHHM